MTTDQDDALARRYRRLALGLIAGCAMATIVYGAFAAAHGKAVQAMMAALLAAAAPFALGGFLGFLFGIPKTLQGVTAETNGERRHAWEANTNLEQVSDWLTKILLGIGLTQLTQLPANIESTGAYIASCIDKDASSVVGSAILIAFSIAGFVVGYLVTKFDLGNAIDEQDGVMTALTAAAGLAPTDRRTVEGLVFASLYVREPAGFESAIQAAEAYLARTDRNDGQDDGALNAYLACAYAQKYQYARDVQSAKDATLAPLRAHTMDNIRTAIAHTKQWKGWFRQLANPPAGSVENDLVVFKDDKDFQSLVDKQPDEPTTRVDPPPGADAPPAASTKAH